MRSKIWWTCSMVALTISTAALAQQKADPRVLWADRDQTRPLFIPQSVLDELPGVDALNIGADQRIILKGLLSRINHCQVSRPKRPEGTPDQLVAWLKSYQHILVAEVERTEPSWSAWYTSVSTLAHLRVRQVLRSKDARFQLGGEAIASIEGGKLEAFGGVACSDLSQPIPAAGSLVLAFGEDPARTADGKTQHDPRYLGPILDSLSQEKSIEGARVLFWLAPDYRMTVDDIKHALDAGDQHE